MFKTNENMKFDLDPKYQTELPDNTIGKTLECLIFDNCEDAKDIAIESIENGSMLENMLLITYLLHHN